MDAQFGIILPSVSPRAEVAAGSGVRTKRVHDDIELSSEAMILCRRPDVLVRLVLNTELSHDRH